MDIETFETLAEVLAFECKDDPSKHRAFCKIFYGEYQNKSPNFIDVESLMRTHEPMRVFIQGEAREGLVKSFDCSHDYRNDHSGLGRGFVGHSSHGETTLNLSIRVRM